jgi:putative ABC transport system permease protein
MMSLSGVTGYARLYSLGYKTNVIISYEEAKPPVAIKQKNFLYADSAFLPMMGYRLNAGDITTALAAPKTAVVTQELAKIYFGKEDPIGKVLHLHDDDENDEWVTVTGVVKEVPQNTHLKFDILFSYKTLLNRQHPNRPDRAKLLHERFEGWSRNDMYTYIRTTPGTDMQALEAKLPALIALHRPDSKNSGVRDVLHLQPLRDIHLTSKLAEESEANGDRDAVFLLGIIGVFVLVIGWINYVNLSTAKSMDRAKEVGVYKVMGAFRHQLVFRFLFESALINALSIVLSFAIVGAVLPAFNGISGLSLTIADMVAPWFLLLSALLWLIGSCLSGFYPALVLSSFRPAAVLKGKLQRSAHGVLLRKSLVVVQFTASVALIAGTFIVYNQLAYMMNGDLGVNIDQVLVLSRPGIGAPRSGTNAMDAFRNELKNDPSVLAVSGSSTIPGKQREYKNNVKRYGAPAEDEVIMRVNSMDFEFMDVFKMKVIAGRAFSQSFPNDRDTALVITESAAKALGFKTPEDAIGQTVTMVGWQWDPIVVGVVNDYHQVSLKQRIEPTVFFCDPFEGEFYSMRITTSDLPRTLSHAKTAWEKAFPGNPFDYSFLDEYFNRQYNNEKQFGELFTTFAALALMIGCIGLFGLSSFTTMQRTKEIGIRKVLGSSIISLFVLLIRDYVKLVLFSIALGVPFVYFMMNRWLEDFAYRSPISALIFVFAGAAVLGIAVLTVSAQIIRAARSNPVDALRYE